MTEGRTSLGRFGSRLVALIAGIALGLAGCGGGDVFVDNVERIRFQGTLYEGGSGNGYAVEELDLAPFGDAEEVAAAVVGTEVYVLRGTDPEDVVIMRSALEDSSYSIFFRAGLLPDGATFEDVARLKGMCPYMAELEVGCQ